jgi:hypothetical protein
LVVTLASESRDLGSSFKLFDPSTLFNLLYMPPDR